MDSKLDGIFRTTFRTTEQTDSWLGIRHGDDRDQGRKDNDAPKDDDEFSFDDDAHVSISALYVFLRDLLIQAGQPAPAQPADQSNTQTPQHTDTLTPPATDTTAQRASMAAQAYQTTARSVTPHLSISDSVPPPTRPPAPQTGPAISLSADEIRTIHTLIQDLETLSARGITTITIRKADTFLHSLRAAMDALLA